MEPAILHQHNSGCDALHINKVMKLDPTRTTLIRRAFMKEVTRRFTSLKKDIYVSIAENDVFGLNAKLKTQVELRPGQFDFPLDMDKVNYFMDWLDNQVQLGILGIGRGVGRKEAAYQSWQNVYIDSSYKKGIFKAQSELKKAGIKVTRTVDASFVSPTHVDRVGMIYSRAYDGLKNITSKMSNQIGSTLATGLAEGRSPRELARILNDRVDKIGITRARTLARTEVVRAHHKATIGEYREYQNALDGVTVLVEWNTAGYDVCEECSEMNGKVYTMDQIEELIPYHPNCRCVALPYIEKLHGKGAKSVAAKKGDKTDFLKSPERWTSNVIKNQNEHIAEYAGNMGLTVEQYTSQMQANIEELISKSDVFVRVPSKAVSNILEEGRLLNYADTRTSGAKMFKAGAREPYFDLRKSFEKDFLGIDLNATGSQRPIYGYLSEDVNGRLLYKGNKVNQYGDVAIKLKPEARAKATWVRGDSLNWNYGVNKDVKLYENIPSPVSEPSYRSWAQQYNTKTEASPFNLKSVDKYFEFDYFEAQMKSVKLSDIEEFIFKKTPKEALQKALDKSGISWRVLS